MAREVNQTSQMYSSESQICFLCSPASVLQPPLACRPERAGTLRRNAVTIRHARMCMGLPLLTFFQFEMKPMQMVVVQKACGRLGQCSFGTQALGIASEQAPASLLLYVGSSISTPADCGTMRFSPDVMTQLEATKVSWTLTSLLAWYI